LAILRRVILKGFKSIKAMDLELRPLNVLIGANGAGKTNLVSFFEMLKASLDARLDGYVGRHGGPNAFLHLGAKKTSEIDAAVTAHTDAGDGTLYQRVVFNAPDTLAYGENHARRPKGVDRSDEMVIDDLCCIIKHGNGEGHPGQSIYFALKDRVGIYHFHDTTLTAPVRMAGFIEDNRVLRGDAGNLAAFLYRLQQTQPVRYKQVRSTVRLAAPFFDDFSLAPRSLDPQQILLNWKQIDTDYEFGPHQLSDGTLRAMCLITLLMQPENELPDLIIVDEPELGLHPYALNMVAALFKKASHHTQVLISTQSSSFLDNFDPEDVVVATREGSESRFARPDPAKLEAWLDEYSLGEVWEKNVIGGGPH
jgi:predicted ATPase